MLTLYNQCRTKPLEKMTIKELIAFYHIDMKNGRLLKSDMIKYIKQSPLKIGSIYDYDTIETICVKIKEKNIYIEVLCQQLGPGLMLFEKCYNTMVENYYFSYIDFEKTLVLYTDDGNWHHKNKNQTYGKYRGHYPILFNQLRKVLLFLDAREWYLILNRLNKHLIHDIIQYIGFILIDHFQLYNIIVK